MTRFSARRAAPVWLALVLALVATLLPSLTTRADAATTTVSGTVSRAGTSEPLAGISVIAYNDLGTPTSATTDASGHYELQVSGATSRFLFTSPRTITHWYGGGEDEPTALAVPLTGAIDVSAELEDAGRVTGTYEGATSAHFVGRTVDGTTAGVSGTISGGTFEGWVTTEKPLHLGLRLSQGAGSFELWNGDKFGREHSEPVQVDSGSTLPGLHFAYPKTATLTGRTTNLAGLPIMLSYFVDVLEDGDWTQVRSGRTGAWHGGFSAIVPASLPLTVSARSPFNNGDFVETWLGDTQDVTQADTVVPAPGSTTAVGDIAVAGGTSAQGTVEDAGGRPVAGVTVDVFRDRTQEIIGTDVTDAMGRYDIPGLGSSATGPITIRFIAERLVPSWGHNRATQETADLIHLEPGDLGTQRVTHLPEFQVQTAAPTVTGSALVGSWVTATPGTATPTPEDTQIWWYCGTTPLGVEGEQYLVTAADAGCALTARQLSILDGHGTGVATSAPLTVRRFETLGISSIVGTRIVGTRLRVGGPGWSVAPDDIDYQWLRRGTPINGATAPTYVPTTNDIGSEVSVRVTGRRAVEDLSATRVVRSYGSIRARTTLAVVGIVERRGRTDVALRFRSPGVASPGGRVQVWRSTRGGGREYVRSLRVTGSPQTIRFTYRSHLRRNHLIFEYLATRYAARAQTTARVIVR